MDRQRGRHEGRDFRCIYISCHMHRIDSDRFLDRTMFIAFPIFYPAGIMLGANEMMMAGCIVSGAIFGDNLAPISDTTIASASTQQFKNGKPADIGGVVSSRIKYSLV